MVFLGSGIASYAYNVWNQKANMPAVARHRTTAFTIGNKGYMGLGHYNSGPNGNIYLEDFWEYDPASNSWTQKADFAGGPRYHAAGIGYGNVAYVGTGRDLTNPWPSQSYTLENDWWEFDPLANTWTPKAPMPDAGRRGAVCFMINDLIFVGTGQVSGGYTSTFYAYDIANDQWLGGVPNFPGGARTSAVAFTIDDKAYVGTGGIGCGNTDIYEYKLSSNSWIPRANIGTLIRNEAVAFAVNGKGYIGTGDNCSSGTNYKDFWEYDPNTDTWTELEEFPGAARRYMNAFVIGNKVYCGSGTSGVNYNDLWEYDQVLSVLSRNDEYLEVKQYPNPATEYTTFDLSNLPEGLQNEDVNLKVMDLSGRTVFEEVFTTSSITMQRNGLPSGMYVYSIWYDSNEIKNGKLIFQ